MKLKLSDMTPALKSRVEAALAKAGPYIPPQDLARMKFCSPPGAAGARPSVPVVAAVGDGGRRPTVEKVAGVRGPNKTEAEYNRMYLGGAGRYEAVTLKLPGGSRYTPDWMTVDAEFGVTLHEVKGSYRFGSQSRALTAFRECAAAFPCFAFVWACRGKGRAGWTVTRHCTLGKAGAS